jgi:hypothetical protein
MPLMGSGRAIGVTPLPGIGRGRGLIPLMGSGRAIGVTPLPGIGRGSGLTLLTGTGRTAGATPLTWAGRFTCAITLPGAGGVTCVVPCALTPVAVNATQQIVVVITNLFRFKNVPLSDLTFICSKVQLCTKMLFSAPKQVYGVPNPSGAPDCILSATCLITFQNFYSSDRIWLSELSFSFCL